MIQIMYKDALFFYVVINGNRINKGITKAVLLASLLEYIIGYYKNEQSICNNIWSTF